MCLVSVIIPVYNVSEYLRECLDSVVGQTYINLEIVCIDDASMDSSSEIIEEYAKTDNRIIALKNDTNKGLSYTRNKGLNYATGTYILFLDSDDYLEKDAVSILVNTMMKYKADMISFDSQTVLDVNFDGTIVYDGKRNFDYKNVMEGLTSYLLQQKNRDFKCTVWQYFYRSEFLKKNNLMFIENIINEDMMFTFMAYMYADRVYILRNCLHYYRIRINSISTQNDIVKNIESFLVGYVASMKYIMNNKDKNDKRFAALEIHLQSFRNGIRGYFDAFSHEERMQYMNMFNNTFYRFVLDDIVGFSQTLGIYENEINEIKKYSEIYIYGAGKAGKKVYKCLEDAGVQIKGFIVSKTDKNADELFGKKVMELADVKDCLKDALIIIGAAPKNQYDIRKNLSNIQTNWMSLNDLERIFE